MALQSSLCVALLLIAAAAIASAARPQAPPPNSHSSFHTLPVPSTLKLRSAPSKPSGSFSNQASVSFSTARARQPIDSWLPIPSDSDDTERLDEGDVEGAMSTTFDPGSGSEDEVDADVNAGWMRWGVWCWFVVGDGMAKVLSF